MEVGVIAIPLSELENMLALKLVVKVIRFDFCQE